MSSPSEEPRPSDLSYLVTVRQYVVILWYYAKTELPSNFTSVHNYPVIVRQCTVTLL